MKRFQFCDVCLDILQNEKGIVGIQDPLRPEVADAVAACQRAGVVVRMVTGDAAAIARNIGKNCGLFHVGLQLRTEFFVLNSPQPCLLTSLLSNKQSKSSKQINEQ